MKGIEELKKEIKQHDFVKNYGNGEDIIKGIVERKKKLELEEEDEEEEGEEEDEEGLEDDEDTDGTSTLDNSQLDEYLSKNKKESQEKINVNNNSNNNNNISSHNTRQISKSDNLSIDRETLNFASETIKNPYEDALTKKGSSSSRWSTYNPRFNTLSPDNANKFVQSTIRDRNSAPRVQMGTFRKSIHQNQFLNNNNNNNDYNNIIIKIIIIIMEIIILLIRKQFPIVKLNRPTKIRSFQRIIITITVEEEVI